MIFLAKPGAGREGWAAGSALWGARPPPMLLVMLLVGPLIGGLIDGRSTCLLVAHLLVCFSCRVRATKSIPMTKGRLANAEKAPEGRWVAIPDRKGSNGKT